MPQGGIEVLHIRMRILGVDCSLARASARTLIVYHHRRVYASKDMSSEKVIKNNIRK
jgi:hypothetical protein